MSVIDLDIDFDDFDILNVGTIKSKKKPENNETQTTTENDTNTKKTNVEKSDKEKKQTTTLNDEKKTKVKSSEEEELLSLLKGLIKEDEHFPETPPLKNQKRNYEGNSPFSSMMGEYHREEDGEEDESSDLFKEEKDELSFRGIKLFDTIKPKKKSGNTKKKKMNLAIEKVLELDTDIEIITPKKLSPRLRSKDSDEFLDSEVSEDDIIEEEELKKYSKKDIVLRYEKQVKNLERSKREELKGIRDWYIKVIQGKVKLIDSLQLQHGNLSNEFHLIESEYDKLDAEIKTQKKTWKNTEIGYRKKYANLKQMYIKLKNKYTQLNKKKKDESQQEVINLLNREVRKKEEKEVQTISVNNEKVRRKKIGKRNIVYLFIIVFCVIFIIFLYNVI